MKSDAILDDEVPGAPELPELDDDRVLVRLVDISDAHPDNFLETVDFELHLVAGEPVEAHDEKYGQWQNFVSLFRHVEFYN